MGASMNSRLLATGRIYFEQRAFETFKVQILAF